MTRALRWSLLLLLLLPAACSHDKGDAVAAGTATASATATVSTLPGPQAPPSEIARRYLDAWNAGRYEDMYALLSAGAKQSISQQAFVDRYHGINNEATIQAVHATPSGSADASTGRAPFSVTITTGLWGDIQQDNVLPLAHDPEGWRVDWSPSLIFKEIQGADLVRTTIDTPKRGAILDRNGKPLAITGSVPVIGTSKNLLNAPRMVSDREGLIRYLAQRLGMSADDIRAKVNDPKTDIDVFIPLKTLPPTAPPTLVTELENTPGVLVQQTPRRIYPNGTAAAHLIGYVGPITAELLDKLRSQGYSEGDQVGMTGLEAAYEKELTGQRGAKLTIITPEGSMVAELANRPSKPAEDVVTTIDIRAQVAAEQALGDRAGSLVLLDPRDNSVVAMASHPTFDPNAFVTGISSDDAAKLLNDPKRPLIDRALTATYPPGSTFKVVTAAAGLEKGGYTPTSRLPCPPVWYGLGQNNPKKNWVDYDEGSLTIAEGLMRSCDPVFYEIGLKLDHIDPNILPSVTAGFGFGRSTGINGLEDASGIDPNPDWKKQQIGEGWFSGDSVNMSIGQGYLLATPIQIANAYSGIAHGGTLRSPVLVRELRVGSQVIQHFDTKDLNPLPMSPSTLAVIRQGTTMVAQDPRGTAYSVFKGSTIDPAGKSGTAEDQGLQSHALFAAYAPRNAAKGVAVVVLDEGESGSLEAGPITRQMLEAWLPIAG